MNNELLETVIELSGLPKDQIKAELLTLMEKEGVDPEKVTEPILRKILAVYLRDVIGAVSKK